MSNIQERDVLLEPWFGININGKELQEDMLKYVSAVEVSDEDEKYSEGIIEVADLDMKWLDGIGIGKGSAIIIRMGHRKNKMSIFRGKISIIEVDYPPEGFPFLVVKCVDTGMQMMESRNSRMYKNTKVSKVVESMHRTAGLEIEVDDSIDIMENIAQTKESYSEFTLRWKKKLGWNYFKKPSGGYYFGRRKISEFKKEILSYRKGGMEIMHFTPTYVDIDIDDSEDENDIDNEQAKKKTSQYTKNYSQVSNRGGDKNLGRL